MTKKIFMAFLMPLLVFTACNQFPDEINVTINTSGYVAVKVIGNDGSPLAGATVEIFSSSRIIFSDVTNASGLVTSGKLLQGSYRLDVSFAAEGLTYRETREIQVIAGETMTFEVSPFANVGNVNIRLESASSWPLPVGLNVLLLPDNIWCGSSNFANCIAAAHFKGTVDSQNEISFENVPVDWYRIWVYEETNSGPRILETSAVRIERGRTINSFVRVWP